jgi:hypothetical protein
MAKPTSRSLSTTPAPPHGISISNPKNIEAVYANQVGISATMTDFTIFFLELGQVPGGPTGAVQSQTVKAAVTLPLPVAQGLVEIIQQMVMGQLEAAKQAAKQRGE